MSKICLLALALCTSVASARVQLAVTVDDLPSHGDLAGADTRDSIALRFLAAFKKHRIRQVYGMFNQGRIDAEPSCANVLNLWTKAGMPLGNHTYSHMDLNTVSPDEFIADLVRNEPYIQAAQPQNTAHWLRYPFLNEGDTLEKREAVRADLSARGYRIAEVSVDFADWLWNPPYVACMHKGDKKALAWLAQSYLDNAVARLRWASRVSQLTFGRQIKFVLLLHIGVFDSLMIDRLLTAFERKGVEFISLEDASADPAYALDTRQTPGVGDTFLFEAAAAHGVKLPPIADEPADKLNSLCQ